MLPSTYETLSYDTLSTSNFFLGVSAPLYVDKINFHPDPQWVRLFLPLPKPVALKACFRPVAWATFESLLEMQIFVAKRVNLFFFF